MDQTIPKSNYVYTKWLQYLESTGLAERYEEWPMEFDDRKRAFYAAWGQVYDMIHYGPPATVSEEYAAMFLNGIHEEVLRFFMLEAQGLKN